MHLTSQQHSELWTPFILFSEKKKKPESTHPVDIHNSGIRAHWVIPACVLFNHYAFSLFLIYMEADPIGCLPQMQSHFLACWESLGFVSLFTLCMCLREGESCPCSFKPIMVSHCPLPRIWLDKGIWQNSGKRNMKGNFLWTSEKSSFTEK